MNVNIIEGPEMLYPPGRILWISPPDEEIDNGAGTTSGEGEAVKMEEASAKVHTVAEADRRSFQKILPLQGMVNDHLPDRYMEVLQQL